MAKMTVLSVALTPQQKELWTKFSEAQGQGPSSMARLLIENALANERIFHLSVDFENAMQGAKPKTGSCIRVNLSEQDLKNLALWQAAWKEPRVTKTVLKLLRMILEHPPVFSADELQTMQKAMSEMSRVGSNLNQFVRLLNILAQEPGKAGIQFDPAELIKILKDMERKNREFRSRARKILLTAVNAGKKLKR